MDKIYEILEIKREDGKTIKVTAGNVVRVNDNNGFISFDLAVNRAKDKNPVFINRINVTNDQVKELVQKFQPGQQVFVVYTEVQSNKTDQEGNPYINLYLDKFWYGRFPQKK